jgi:hypothetical protein
LNSKTALLGGGVVLLLVGASAGYLYGVSSTSARTTTSVTTTTTTLTTASIPSTVPDTYDQVAGTYADHLLLLEARNASALASQYETNATIEWKGVSGGCDGNYTGTGSITMLLGDLLTRSSSLLVSNETQTIGAEGKDWVVNSTFNFVGNSTFVGIFVGRIAAQDSYFSSGQTWSIAKETWNFLSYDSSFIDGYPVSICEPYALG